MIILGIDPGTTESAYLVMNSQTKEICYFKKVKNEEIIKLINETHFDIIAIEGIVSYGMPMGNDTIQTVFWLGRFYENTIKFQPNTICLILSRQDIKMTICKTVAKVNDGNIRQALIDKYGPQGTKPKPGPLYGIAGDIWSALAVCTHIIECKNIKNLYTN